MRFLIHGKRPKKWVLYSLTIGTIIKRLFIGTSGGLHFLWTFDQRYLRRFASVLCTFAFGSQNTASL